MSATNESNAITIGSATISVVEYAGQRVVTFEMIDTLHQRPEGTAGRNFRENRERFIEGEDFHAVCADEIRRHKILQLSPKARGNVTLLTESGYAMLAKSLTDDLSWTVQRLLVRSYFRKPEPTPAVDQVAALNDPTALRGILLGYTEKVIALEAENAVLSPKAAALDELAGTEGKHNLRWSAAQCQMKEGVFIDALIAEGWCYRHTITGRITIYAKARDDGWMTAKNVTIQHRSGEREGIGQPMLTQRGLAKIKEILLRKRGASRPFARTPELAS